MKAIVFDKPKSLSIQQVPDPICGPDEVIVKVTTSGICGTDLHIYQGEYMGEFPLIPGHEFSGVVVEVGRDVDYLSVGDRVAPDPNIFCNHCEFCRNDRATTASIGAAWASPAPGVLQSMWRFRRESAILYRRA